MKIIMVATVAFAFGAYIGAVFNAVFSRDMTDAEWRDIVEQSRGGRYG